MTALSANLTRTLYVALADQAAADELKSLIEAGLPNTSVLTGSLTLSSGADLIFSGTTGQNEIRITDNLADALSIKITSGADFLVFDTTDSNEKLTILSAATQKLGFYGTTPAVQPSGAAQAALTNSTGGTADGTLSAVGATNGGDVSAAINNNFTELHTLLNSIRSALVTLGLIKGSA